MDKNITISTKSPLYSYDALQDKHASFYFNGYGVRKHLKKLKKVKLVLSRLSKWNLSKEIINNIQKFLIKSCIN